MGLTHGAGWNIMGVPTSEIKIWGDTLVAMERAATTYLTTYAFNKAAGNSTSSFDMTALAGVMLSAGVMESVLTRYGFTETRSHLDAWNANELPVFMKDTVAVLGGGFADAAFAAAFSGEPMNPEVVFAMSMGRLVGRQIGYGVEAMYPAKTPTAAVNTLGVQGSSYHTQTAEELIAHQSGAHRIQAPNLVPPTTTSSLGYTRSVPDSVEDTLPNTQTPRAKALMTPAYHNAIQEEVFAAGNPTYQASRARTGASHRQVGMRSAVESSYTQLSAISEEMPFYGPSRSMFVSQRTQGEAAWQGVQNYGDNFWSMVMHPVDTAVGIGQGLWNINQAGNSLIIDTVLAANYFLEGQPISSDVSGRFNSRGDWVASSWDTMSNMSGPDWTEFAVEEGMWILTGGVGGLAVKSASRAGASLGRRTAPIPVNISKVDEYVLSNIMESQKARGTSNFMIFPAKESQIVSGYGVDTWSMMSLSKGDIVYGGLPAQSAFYTSKNTLLRFGDNPETLFESLQVKPHPVLGYRTQMGAYEVMHDMRVPSGVAKANVHFGAGEGHQYFINNFDNRVQLINRIEIGENYGPQLPTYKIRP